MSGPVVAQCMRARIAWDGLLPQVLDRLCFNPVVALARVDEANARARLAFDTTQQGWTVGQLKDAIARVGDGSYRDTDPATVDAGKLRGPQRARCVQALAPLKAQIAQLDAELGVGGT